MVVVKSADRVIQIFETVGSYANGVTHGELSKVLSIPKGSLSLLLSNLVERDYLTFDRWSKLYMLGPRLLVLTGRYLSSLDIVSVGRQVVREFVAEINEDTEIVGRKGDQVIFLYKEECVHPLKYSIAIGEIAPLYATSAGKAILAFLPEDEISAYLSSVTLSPITKNSITDPEKLRRELKEVRGHGLAYGREEFHEGICAIASPVFNRHGKVAGSLTVTLPKVRFSNENRRFIEPRLVAASSEISRRLGFDGVYPGGPDESNT
jgi:DNA-binding IclR family transcriptional regulator